MPNVASRTAGVHDDVATSLTGPYPPAAYDASAMIDTKLEKPLQPFLLRERRKTPLWIITRR